MISVIIPVYNVEVYLEECINSVFAQTYTDLEIILVDDGSNDRSGEICDFYRNIDPRIRVFHTDNHGLSEARNYGIDHLCGDYIYFIDSDDWINPDVLEKGLDRIGSADVLCFGCPSAYYSGHEALVAHINGKIGPAAWNKLYKRECFSSIRFPKDRKYEDMATTYKILYKANKVVCIDYSGYHYRSREGSICHTIDLKNIIDYWKSCKERYDYCIKIIGEDALETRINLLKSCGEAISRAWAWRSSVNPSDSPVWNEMAVFARTMFPLNIKSRFPLRIRGGLFLAQYNRPWAFWCAHTAHVLTREMHN